MLRKIFTQNKKWMFFTYAVLIIENLLFAICPWFLGKSIDALIEGQTTLFIQYICLTSIAATIGFTRRRLDTRVFMSIWRTASIESIEILCKKNIESPKIISRASNVYYFANFFESVLPIAIGSVIYIIISLVAIAGVLGTKTIILLVLGVLSLVISYHVANKSAVVENLAQNEREERESAIVVKDMKSIEHCYNNLSKLYIKKSDLDAYNWGILDIILIIGELFVILNLVAACQSPGIIMATTTYLYQLFGRITTIGSFFNYVKEIMVYEQRIELD